MNDLDSLWNEILAEAAKNPALAPPGIVSDFLELKTANDAIRQTAVGWLFDAMRRIAEHANARRAGIVIETKDAHRFAYHHAMLSGSLISFRQGVRCLTAEAGWTRAPGDGFMRAGALAVARLTHFGIPRAGVELHLLKFEDRPQWFVARDDRTRISFELEDLIKHFQIFLG